MLGTKKNCSEYWLLEQNTFWNYKKLFWIYPVSELGSCNGKWLGYDHGGGGGGAGYFPSHMQVHFVTKDSFDV